MSTKQKTPPEMAGPVIFIRFFGALATLFFAFAIVFHYHMGHTPYALWSTAGMSLSFLLATHKF